MKLTRWNFVNLAYLCAMSDCLLIAPSPPLAPYVRYYWILETDFVSEYTERVIPFGNIQLCFYRGNIMCGTDKWDTKALLCGQTTSYTDVVCTGKIRIISVVFHTYGTKAFFTMPMNELRDLKALAGDIVDRELKELEDRIRDTDGHGECIRLIECFLQRRLSPLPDYNHQRLEAVIKLINNNKGNISIASLTETACLSKKQFQRVFSENIGTNPKEFLRTVRFQNLLSQMCHTASDNFTRLACDCGYYDQSHLIHEFKTFSGYTPKEYLAICSPYSDYFQQ